MADDTEPEDPPRDEQREWMRRWGEGDTRAGDQLTQALFPLVRAFARRRLPEEQEDVVQETFLRLATNVQANRFRGDSTVRSYVLGIARNVSCRTSSEGSSTPRPNIVSG